MGYRSQVMLAWAPGGRFRVISGRVYSVRRWSTVGNLLNFGFIHPSSPCVEWAGKLAGMKRDFEIAFNLIGTAKQRYRKPGSFPAFVPLLALKSRLIKFLNMSCRHLVAHT